MKGDSLVLEEAMKRIRELEAELDIRSNQLWAVEQARQTLEARVAELDKRNGELLRRIIALQEHHESCSVVRKAREREAEP